MSSLAVIVLGEVANRLCLLCGPSPLGMEFIRINNNM